MDKDNRDMFGLPWLSQLEGKIIKCPTDNNRPDVMITTCATCQKENHLFDKIIQPIRLDE